jgi:hypothetical protein
MRMAVALAPLCLAACAAFSPSLPKTEAPAPENAYLYGRFSIEAPKAWLSLAGHQTMGFSLDCGSGQNILIKFKVEEPLQVLKVAPASKCKFREIVYTDSDGGIRSRKPAPPALSKEIEFLPGKAYYLGDYFAATTNTYSGNTIYTQWEIKSSVDEYAASTEEMRKAYPAFANTPTEKKMLGRN